MPTGIPPQATRLAACIRLLGLGLLAVRSLALGGAFPNPEAVRDALRREAERITRRYAPPRSDHPPVWAQRSDPPLATLAVLADLHYDDTGAVPWTRASHDRLLKVIRYLNEAIKPDRVLLLGDLIALERPGPLRRVKGILDKQLIAPYSAVWGNHDGPAFEGVFGPANYALAVGGVRLVALGLNYVHWDSGWGSYDRLDWLAAELSAHPREPTLILTHNPVALPTFANNAAVLRVLDAQPQVLAVFAGHMHVDYEFPLAKPHFGAPMLARPPHAFKVLRVHPDRILILTYEERDGAYAQAPIYQKVDIPPALRPSAPAK